MSRRSLATVGVVLSLTLGGSAAQAWPHRHHDTQQSTIYFQREIAALTDERVAAVEASARAGELPQAAVAAAHSDRAEIQQHVREAAADGVITTREDRRIREAVREIGVARGGGPYYYGHEYYGHHWHW
jgi:uncharacterized membrane protein YebE (DUF533 family)